MAAALLQLWLCATETMMSIVPLLLWLQCCCSCGCVLRLWLWLGLWLWVLWLRLGLWLWPGLAGVIIVEATKQVYAVAEGRRERKLSARLRPALSPVPGGVAPANRVRQRTRG